MRFPVIKMFVLHAITPQWRCMCQFKFLLSYVIVYHQLNIKCKSKLLLFILIFPDISRVLISLRIYTAYSILLMRKRDYSDQRHLKNKKGSDFSLPNSYCALSSCLESYFNLPDKRPAIVVVSGCICCVSVVNLV